MEGVSFEDLEAYLLNEDLEEWQEKQKAENSFENLEENIEYHYSSIFNRYFSEGKHCLLDLPIASNYELSLSFSDSGEITDLFYS